MYYYNIDYCGETNKITVIGVKFGLVSLIPPTKAFYLAETFTETTKTPIFWLETLQMKRFYVYTLC